MGEVVGLTWQWRYDQKGRLSEIEGPGNVTTRVTYTEPEAKSGKGETSAVEFDGEKRTFTWDPQGRLLSAKGSAGEVVLNHNKAGLPAEVRSGNMPAIRYKYDVQDRLTEMQIGDVVAVRHRYDYLGRPAAIATPAGEITYSYDRAENRVVRRLPNGVQTFREYDEEGKLIALTHVDPKNFIIAKYVYTYRPDGLIGEITETTQRSGEKVCRYEYDLMQRLAGVDCGEGHSYRYGYDLLGNMAEWQNAANPALRFTSTPAGGLATDSRGPTRTDERGHIRQIPDSPGPIDYAFNGAGELSAAVANGKKIGFAYNALGLLTARSVDGRETRYLPDPFADAWHPLWQRDPEGKETVTVWEGPVPLVALQGEEVRFRLEDHLGSVRVEVDNGGGISAWHDYTPFGVEENAENGGDLRPGFAGLFWDPAARVYHAMARAYDPVTARFLQPDPQLRVPGASKQSHSLYAYTGGDPVNFVDRNGAEAVSLDSQGVWWDAFGNSLSKWRLPHLSIDQKGLHANFPPPSDMPQRFDDGSAIKWDGTRMQPGEAKQFFVNTVRSYELAELQKNYEGKDFSKLSQREQTMIRNIAVSTFAEHYSDYPGHSIEKKYLKDFNQYVANMNIETIDGSTSLDWTTTTIDSKRTFWFSPAFQVMSPGQRLTFGKVIHNIVSPRIGQKEFPEGSVFEIPQNNLNAISLIKRLQNTNQSVASTVFTPKKIMGVSVVASSRPLTTEEYAAWKTSRSHNEPASRSTQGDRWSQFGNNSGQWGGGGPCGLGGCGPGGPGGPWDSGGGGGGRGGLGGGSSFSIQSPSPVGGVHLGGAGKALEGLGQLKGIAVDEATGKLALIGSDEQKFALPPLRLDDVVTVFRAVYNHGQAPSVTIDPDEENPKGPTMDVKHGPGTEGTYVGWILFECDRIMKSYQLGEDNVTHVIVNSRIPGYTKTLEAVFFGDPKQKDAKDSGWERFWIVPAAVRRFDAVKTGLSLFEVPLKVNTQKMKWKNEKKNGRMIKILVDDETGESSHGALAFKNWFSDHYDEIADEVRLPPPPGSGFKEPVAIFHELRRIALITAVAERLRDLGEPMPAWMRDYPVAPFPVSKTTPSLIVEKPKQDGSAISHIYGGVNLAPADKDLRTYSDAKKADAKPVSRDEVTFVNLSKEETALLTSKIPELARINAPVGTIHPVATPQGKTLSVVLLPGAQTRALAPNRQEVSDLVVPIGLGRSIALTRYYHSFFDPAGAFGRGWTLNLPELLKTPVPVKRDGKRSEFRIVQHMVSPLGTVDIRFDKTEMVAPYGVKMSVAKDHPEIAGIGSGESKIVGAKTDQLLFRDGTEWHFDDGGRLVLAQAEGAATRYVRDSAGRVQQIVGYIGAGPVAEIRLGYDPQGRIVEAKATQKDDLRRQTPAETSKLNFEYGEDGRLRAVLRPESKEGSAPKAVWAYSYEADHLSKIGGAGRVETSFGYDGRGQLLWKKEGDRKMQYTVTITPQGATFTSGTDEGGAPSEKWLYDAQMRPLEADLGGGRTVRWRYGKDHEASESLSQDGKPILTRSISQDGRTETMVLTDGPTYEVRKDPSGHPTTLSIDGVKAATISWQEDGTLGGLRADDTEIQPRRHQKGWPNGVVISAPMISGKTSEWLEEEWDVMGWPTKITDSSGFEYKMGYDDQGRLRTFGKMTKDGKVIGSNLVYSDDGLLTGVDSSWGKEKREYENEGILKSVKIEREGAKSVTSYDAHGRPVNHSAFDGGATTWRYDSDDAGAALRAIGLPNGKEIRYASKDSGKGRSTQASLGSTVVQTASDTEGKVTALTWGEKAP